MTEALNEAIKIAGNRTKLAQALGIDNSNISQWVARKRVPAKHALKIQELYGVQAGRFAYQETEPV